MGAHRILKPIRFLHQAETRDLDPDVCWKWEGPVNSNGYGRFIDKDHHLLAHRVAYELFIGPISDGLNVCHTCDERLCVNPHHLWLGSQSDNLKDAAAKGRMFRPDTNGERNGNRKLSADHVRTIRAMFSGGQRRYQIAERFGVSPGTVGAIIAGKIWKDVA
jgi:hypothetical protein